MTVVYEMWMSWCCVSIYAWEMFLVVFMAHASGQGFQIQGALPRHLIRVIMQHDLVMATGPACQQMT
jgi:hypothetical protein